MTFMRNPIDYLKTERLTLRRWQESDLAPFTAMNMDAEVMQYFPSILTPEQTQKMIEKIEEGFSKKGFGLWAIETNQTKEFVGFAGLSEPSFSAHFTPCTEIGWRIASKFWGQGYAPEAAREILKDAFKRLNLPEVVSFTAKANSNSIRVMRKLGMIRDPKDDFNHPAVEANSRLAEHVLYRLSKKQWLALFNKNQPL
jgi:RimJ/RimL family protein N-acetyltransferase